MNRRAIYFGNILSGNSEDLSIFLNDALATRGLIEMHSWMLRLKFSCTTIWWGDNWVPVLAAPQPVVLFCRSPAIFRMFYAKCYFSAFSEENQRSPMTPVIRYFRCLASCYAWRLRRFPAPIVLVDLQFRYTRWSSEVSGILDSTRVSWILGSTRLIQYPSS